MQEDVGGVVGDGEGEAENDDTALDEGVSGADEEGAGGEAVGDPVGATDGAEDMADDVSDGADENDDTLDGSSTISST